MTADGAVPTDAPAADTSGPTAPTVNRDAQCHDDGESDEGGTTGPQADQDDATNLDDSGFAPPQRIRKTVEKTMNQTVDASKEAGSLQQSMARIVLDEPDYRWNRIT